MDKATQNREKKLGVLRAELSEFDLVVPGTIRMMYLKCGKPNCACWKDKKACHGPYYFWDRKVAGKLSSKSVKKQMATSLKKWIENRKRVQRLLTEILKLCQSIAADKVAAERKRSGKM